MTASTTLSKSDRSSSPRWLTCVAAIALLGAHTSALWAQVPLQQAPLQSSQSINNQIDPPGSIARLSLIEGAVSYAPGNTDNGNGNDNAWTAAQLNRPLTAGDRLWTGEQSRTELHAGSTAIRLNSQTSLDLLALDDNTTQLRLSQGTVRLRVRQLFEGQRLEVDTPNLAFVISQPGDYRIDANPAADTTRVVAQSGAGVLYGDSGTPITLGNQQQGNFSGTNLTPAAPGSAVLDSFDNWAMARDQREDQSVSARYVPRETVGYQQLDNYGDWSQDPSYGPVWLPRAVPANWAPYRAGHWSWIAPWGWTWVDDAPWGFAPFHYGRWAQIGPRWAWVPGRLQPRPVYAPALVAFIGGNLGGSSGGVNWNISLGSGGPAQPAVGWFPLAPGEAFRPAYRVSPRYVTRVNNNIEVNNTVNVTNVYRYQRQPAAVTAIAATDFARGQPVRGNVALNAADLGRAQVVDGGRGIPQRPDRAAMREEPRAVAAALPPPAATARPVVNLRDERRDGRREARDDRQGNFSRNQQPVQPATQAAVSTAPVASPPAAVQRIAPQAQDNRAVANDENRLRRERDQQRTVQRPPEQESIGQRALREQAQRERGDAMPSAPRPAVPANDSIEQARREQQRLQQEQQRLQREQLRQADRQQRQNEESIGQRALRDAAARDQQAAKQQEEARRQQQRAEQAQQQTQQNQLQNQVQSQQQAQEKNQQRQAHEQAQRQQQEQRKQQQQQASEERQQSRKAEAAAREARNDAPAPPNRQQ
ncbi:MAG: DUF6600 domain-containing protein [Pseudomonadota bacterium]